MSATRRALAAIFAAIVLLATPKGHAAVPLVRNYNPVVYGAGAQNWAVAQDSLGRMYFGNRDGLLSFDSRHWQLTRLPNYTTVRTIYIDNATGHIYVGASNDFGYFASDSAHRSMEYHSLVPTIEGSPTSFSEIWNIHSSTDGTLWFQGDYLLFRHKDKHTRAIASKDKITASALIDGQMYAGLLHGGLVHLVGNNLMAASGADELRGKRIVAILPYTANSLMIVTAFDGLYRLKDGILSHESSRISDYLRDNQAFSATVNADRRHYAFGTVNGGVVLMNAPDDITMINMGNGMQNNTVLNLAFDRNDNLWLALDNGIDFAVSASSIRNLLSPTWNYGAGYASFFLGNALLLGTNQGLYTIPYSPGAEAFEAPRKQTLIKGQIWSLDTIAGDILVGADGGLYHGDGSHFRAVEGVSGTWAVRPLNGHPDKALASTYEGFALIGRDTQGHWRLLNFIDGIRDVGGRFVQDARGDLWVAHWMRGVYRLRLSPDLKRFTQERLFTDIDGLPTNRNNLVSEVGGRMVFSTEGGFYGYNEHSGRFEPDSLYNRLLRAHPSSRLYKGVDSNDLWLVAPEHVWRLTADASGSFALDTTSYQSLSSKIIPGSDDLRFITPNRAIMASQDGFFEIDLNFPNELPSNSRRLHISAVYANLDSLLYTPATRDHETDNFSVSHRLNSLRFEFVLPEYRADRAVEYSCLLEGYDKDWSPWTFTGSKEYTQLSEGSYTLHVRARDRYDGTTAETSFSFKVRPPWWRSLPAKIVYLLAVLAMIWLGWRAVERHNRNTALRISREKEEQLERLQREAHAETLRKDVEISQLKSLQLEHDIRHKSEELSNLTMNVIRKNEILMDISGKITRIQDDLMGADSPTAKQLSHIQTLIEENISHDDDWKAFTRNFDVVYENYTQRLTDLHPDLSATDLRVCCYLKMGLSSKEIAPLFHISYRSVEMTRYRLRKKMGLNRETNLTDYLQRI